MTTKGYTRVTSRMQRERKLRLRETGEYGHEGAGFGRGGARGRE